MGGPNFDTLGGENLESNMSLGCFDAIDTGAETRDGDMYAAVTISDISGNVTGFELARRGV